MTWVTIFFSKIIGVNILVAMWLVMSAAKYTDAFSAFITTMKLISPYGFSLTWVAIFFF